MAADARYTTREAMRNDESVVHYRWFLESGRLQRKLPQPTVLSDPNKSCRSWIKKESVGLTLDSNKVNFRDQKVAGSNPVTSTKILSEDYNLQTFLLFGFARFSLQNPLFPEQIRIPADMPPFGFNRMTTDKGGCMELRVWFWGAFSVRDVHWQKRVEMSGRDGKKGCACPKGT